MSSVEKNNTTPTKFDQLGCGGTLQDHLAKAALEFSLRTQRHVYLDIDDDGKEIRLTLQQPANDPPGFEELCAAVAAEFNKALRAIPPVLNAFDQDINERRFREGVWWACREDMRKFFFEEHKGAFEDEATLSEVTYGVLVSLMPADAEMRELLEETDYQGPW